MGLSSGRAGQNPGLRHPFTGAELHSAPGPDLTGIGPQSAPGGATPVPYGPQKPAGPGVMQGMAKPVSRPGQMPVHMPVEQPGIPTGQPAAQPQYRGSMEPFYAQQAAQSAPIEGALLGAPQTGGRGEMIANPHMAMARQMLQQPMGAPAQMPQQVPQQQFAMPQIDPGLSPVRRQNAMLAAMPQGFGMFGRNRFRGY